MDPENPDDGLAKEAAAVFEKYLARFKALEIAVNKINHDRCDQINEILTRTDKTSQDVEKLCKNHEKTQTLHQNELDGIKAMLTNIWNHLGGQNLPTQNASHQTPDDHSSGNDPDVESGIEPQSEEAVILHVTPPSRIRGNTIEKNVDESSGVDMTVESPADENPLSPRRSTRILETTQAQRRSELGVNFCTSFDKKALKDFYLTGAKQRSVPKDTSGTTVQEVGPISSVSKVSPNQEPAKQRVPNENESNRAIGLPKEKQSIAPTRDDPDNESNYEAELESDASSDSIKFETNVRKRARRCGMTPIPPRLRIKPKATTPVNNPISSHSKESDVSANPTELPCFLCSRRMIYDSRSYHATDLEKTSPGYNGTAIEESIACRWSGVSCGPCRRQKTTCEAVASESLGLISRLLKRAQIIHQSGNNVSYEEMKMTIRDQRDVNAKIRSPSNSHLAKRKRPLRHLTSAAELGMISDNEPDARQVEDSDLEQSSETPGHLVEGPDSDAGKKEFKKPRRYLQTPTTNKSSDVAMSGSSPLSSPTHDSDVLLNSFKPQKRRFG